MKWIHSRSFDLIWFIGPAFVASLLSIGTFIIWAPTEISPLVWLLLVVGIDVTHVYSSFFRSYLNPTDRTKFETPLKLIPLVCFVTGVLLYSVSPLLFWRVLAYIAVFHFIRQQYGFFAIYSKKSGETLTWLAKSALYLSMLFPIVYWHVSNNRTFSWFIAGDFFSIFPVIQPWLVGITLAAFVASFLVYFAQEFKKGWRSAFSPRNMLLLGTALSWNVGIVVFNNDFIFTVTNIVTHGVPYLALLYLYGKKMAPEIPVIRPLKYQHLFGSWRVIFYFCFLFLFAYIEEGVWDSWVWNEHALLFPAFDPIRATLEPFLVWLIPLLTLPQATHYVLDGFIWKLDERKNHSVELDLFAKSEAQIT